MPSTLSTAAAAHYLGVHPASVARLCRKHGVQGRPARVGRSTVTAWPVEGIAAIAKAQLAAKGMPMPASADDDAELLEAAEEVAYLIGIDRTYTPVAEGARLIAELAKRYAAGELLTAR